MNNDNENAVLSLIGQITLKINMDDDADLKRVLQIAENNGTFQNSKNGREYIRMIKTRLARPKAEGNNAIDSLIRESDKKTIDLLHDIDESLFRVASQKTTRSTQKIVWVNVAITVLNTVAIFFLALFVWKLNMS